MDLTLRTKAHIAPRSQHRLLVSIQQLLKCRPLIARTHLNKPSWPRTYCVHSARVKKQWKVKKPSWKNANQMFHDSGEELRLTLCKPWWLPIQ